MFHILGRHVAYLQPDSEGWLRSRVDHSEGHHRKQHRLNHKVFFQLRFYSEQLLN
jgi:hypothetical protein